MPGEGWAESLLIIGMGKEVPLQGTEVLEMFWAVLLLDLSVSPKALGGHANREGGNGLQ